MNRASLVATLGLGPSALGDRTWELGAVDTPPSPELGSLLREGPTRLLRCLAPLAAGAVTEIAGLLGDGPLLDGAFATLVKRIGNVAMPVLVAEVQIERRRRAPTAKTGAERLEELADRLASRIERQRLVETYPVLARRVALTVDQWRSGLAELWARIERDRTLLARQLDARGRLTGLRSDLGDRHRGGRAVTELIFESGERILYKPRPLGVEARLQTFLADRAEHAGLELASRSIIDRGSYGWDTWVDQDVTIPGDAVPRYFRRVGILLATLLPLQIRDLHCANLVASGAWPVVLDGETILMPDPRRAGPLRRVDLSATVIATGALPGRGTVPEVSALGAVPDTPLATGGPVLVDAYSDKIAIDRVGTVTLDPRSLPVADGCRSPAGQHVDEILAGFDEGYEAVLSAPSRWRRFVEECNEHEVRVVVRPTRIYAELQLASTDPAVLTDALAVDALYDHLGVDRSVPLSASLLASERAQLHALDTPVFTARVSGTRLIGGDGTNVDGLVQRSGTTEPSRLDGRRQRHLIESALTTSPTAPRQFGGLGDARAIGNLLAELALPGIEGTTWVRPTIGDDGATRLEPLGLDLYDGLPGVVLFLAQLGDTDLARAGTVELLASLEGAELSAGAWGGAAGVAYVLDHLARAWRDAELAAASLRVLEQALTKLGPDDPTCMVSGAAGLALVASRIARLDEDGPARRVMNVARRTIEDNVTSSAGEPCWPAAEHHGRTVGGVAHGLAGIAWALGPRSVTGRRVRRTEGRRFRAALTPATAPDHPEASNSWCHGAPGFALAESALAAEDAEALEDAGAVERIEWAVANALAAPAPDTDGLCHGGLGSYDSLAVAGRLMGRSEWVAEARARTRGLVARGTTEGWRLAATSATPPVGLMTGIAGVGHALLRLADPSLPSVMALE